MKTSELKNEETLDPSSISALYKGSRLINYSAKEYLKHKALMTVGGSVYEFLKNQQMLRYLDGVAKMTKGMSSSAIIGLTGYPTYADSIKHEEPTTLSLIKGAAVAAVVVQGMSSLEDMKVTEPLFHSMSHAFKDPSLTLSITKQFSKTIIKSSLLAPLANTFIIENELKDQGHGNFTANLATTIGVLAGLGVNLVGTGAIVTGAAETATGVMSAPGVASIAGGSYLIANSYDVAKQVAEITAEGIDSLVDGYPKVQAWISQQVDSLMTTFECHQNPISESQQDDFAMKVGDLTGQLLEQANQQGVKDDGLMLLGYLLQQELATHNFDAPIQDKAEHPPQVSMSEMKAELNQFIDEMAADVNIEMKIAEAKAPLVIEDFKKKLSELIHTWANEEIDISEYENCPEIVSLASDVDVCNGANPGSEKAKFMRNQLKDAIFKEQAKRVKFDSALETTEGLVGLASAGTFLLGNRKVASKIIKGGSALLKIGKNVGALAGVGKLAACVNPYLAAGSIALSACEMLSLFDDADNSMEMIFEQLQDIKSMIADLRSILLSRFDIVDEKLEDIYKKVCQKSKEILLQIEKVQMMVKNAAQDNEKLHEDTHAYLQNLQSEIKALFAIVREGAVEQALQAVTNPINACLNHINPTPAPEQYAAWLAQFQTFFEQTSYSATLTGKTHYGVKVLEGKAYQGSANEGYFYVNSLHDYLKRRVEKLKTSPRQPNFLVWAFASMAIVRLIYLGNHNDQAKIRRNEFNILLKIKAEAEQQIEFHQSLQQSDVADTLIWRLAYDARKVAANLRESFAQFLDRKNTRLNETLCLEYKNRWTLQSHALDALKINIKTDYPGWYYNYCQTHYGSTEIGRGQQAIGPYKQAYMTQRRSQLEAFKNQPDMPVYKLQKGLNHLSFEGTQRYDSISISGDDIPHLGISPKQQGLPIINLYTAQGIIDIKRILQVPDVCFKAEYLGIGQLSYEYEVDKEGKSLHITANFFLKSQSLELSICSFPFDLGVYDTKEGVIWAWFGTAATNLTHTTVNWVGSTGEAKHWFVDHGDVPVIQNATSVPMQVLLQGSDEVVPVIIADKHKANIIDIEKAVTAELDAIFKAYKLELQNQTKGHTKLGFSITDLSAAYHRMHLFLMLVAHDKFNHFDDRVQWLFNDDVRADLCLEVSDGLVDESIDPKEILSWPDKLEALAKVLEGNKAKIAELRNLNTTKSGCGLLDKIYALVIDACQFYEKRVDESGTYKDIFEANQKTGERFDAVNQLLGMLAKNVMENVTDEAVIKQIVVGMKNDMEEAGITLPEDTKLALQQKLNKTDKDQLSFKLESRRDGFFNSGRVPTNSTSIPTNSPTPPTLIFGNDLSPD